MEATPAFVRVAPSDLLPAREGLDSELYEVEAGEEIVLVGRRGDGQVVAFSPTCPHDATDLAEATFVDGMVRCPRHNYLYNPCTGENVVPFKITKPENMWKLRPGYLPRHAVEERDGWVWVCTEREPPPDVWDPQLEIPPPLSQRQSRGTIEAPARPAAPETVKPEPEHRQVGVSTVFELDLPMDQAPPAHAWNVVATDGILTVVSQRLEMDPSPRLRVQVATRALGQGTVTCTFGRPWDVVPAEVRTYIVDVTLPS